MQGSWIQMQRDGIGGCCETATQRHAHNRQAAREADRKRWAEDDRADDEASFANTRARVRRAFAGEDDVDMPDPTAAANPTMTAAISPSSTT